MIHTVLTLSALLAVPSGPSSLAVPVPLQEDESIVDGRPEIKELLGDLKGHVKRKAKEDEEAKGVIDKLLQEWEHSGPKDRKEIVKGLDACFKAKRPKELEPGVPDDRLYYAAATALGRMGPESVKPLTKLLGHKSHRKNLRLQQRVALSLGMTKDEDAIKPLLDLLKDDQPEMQAAGADALGNYDKLALKERKKIFEEVLKIMTGQKAQVDQDPTNQEADQRWRMISGPMNATLRRLSGHEESSPEAWRSWWNDNKKADWDAEGE